MDAGFSDFAAAGAFGEAGLGFLAPNQCRRSILIVIG